MPDYERELIDSLREWKDEMKGVVADYTKGMHTLDDAVQAVNDSKKKWWVEYKTYIVIAICVFLLVGALAAITYIMNANNVCYVSASQKENNFLIKSCEKNK